MCRDCERLHEQLKHQAYELHQLKRAVIKARKESRRARRRLSELKRETIKQQHYRNGKRGTIKNG